MGEKGKQTREMIREQAKKLFAQKGFSQVTMKDICEVTGLSRGGLYRHYESTAQIFEEMFTEMSQRNEDLIDQGIAENIPAFEILKKEIQILKEEMMCPQESLSLSIYEYANFVDSDLFDRLNSIGTQKWNRLMKYGIQRGEFREENAMQAITMILYAYQGIRMWSRVIPISAETADNYEYCINQLLKK